MNRSKSSLSAHLPWRKIKRRNVGAQESSLSPLQSSLKRITYRVQDLPGEYSWGSTAELLEATFGFDKGQSDITVDSLAYGSGYSGLKTATISSVILARNLNGKTNQWTFQLLDHAHTTADGQSRPHVIVLDSHFEGLTPRNSFPNQQEHLLDVIALTGLGGHAFTSFKQREQDFMWLRDTLPEDLPGAQVWIYGYDSKLTASLSFQDLEALSSTFRRTLASSRRRYTGSSNCIPLVFLGHSLGGLVLKEALVQMSQDHSTEMAATYKAIYGILFFGCPNQGMNIDPLLDWCDGQPNQQLLITLKHSSERLRRLCRDFSNSFTFPDSRIICFYETKLSPTAAKSADGVWSMTGPPSILVDASSATHGRPGEDQVHHIHPLNRNHSEMVKFGRKDVEYGIVLGFLEEFAKSASDIIRARFSADRKLPNSVERVTFKNRPSLFGTAGDDAQFHEISRWLAPAVYECGHYQDDLEDARSSRHRETCRWIEARPEFVKWSNGKDEETQSLLWIHAIPGAGKTVLASYLVDHLEKPDNVDTQPQPIFYFFCKNADTDKNNALAITKALAHQLIQSPHVARHNILKDLRFQMDRGGRSRAINFRPLFEMISQHLSILPRAIIIIDAADECSDIDQLLPRLIQLTEKGTARVVLTSRREPHLVNILQNKPGLGMGPGDVQEDIKSYLEYQVSQSGFLSDPRVRHRITRILNTRSKGMFLWVALMIKELKHCSTIEDVEYTLDRLPDGLNAVYELILTRLHNFLKPPRKTFCCRLLKWITLAKRPLRLTEVGEALKIQYEAAIDDIGYTQHLLCSTHEVESVCGSLVTVKDGIIQLIHLSTKEFLIDQERASNLRQDLHAFFVRTQEDNALLSGICVEYLSTCCIPGKLSRDDSSKGWQMDNAKLLEYAYLNWILHLNESTSETLVRQVPILQGFLASRNSLYWLEICFTIDRDIYGTLSTHLQAVLDWCLRCEPKVSGSRSPQGLVSLFHYWAKSYLQLLDDYGPSLKEWPHEVHFIDPERVFEPSSFQILESLRQNGSYHRHHVLNDPKLRRISTIVPTHRALPKYTSAKEDYSYIFVDERRQVFFTLDKYVTRAPHIYCQEITSGKRLTPIVDTELGENNHDLQTRGATLSACGRYLGIVYSWPETKEIPQSFKVNTTIYTAIWLLSEHFDFSCAGRPQWARKLISLSTTAPVNILGMQSANPIAFGGDGFVYCPHGRVDLSSGVQEPIFCAPDSREPLDVTFSGDGRTAVGFEGVSSHLQEISPKGELTTIYPYKKDIISLGALSSSGRFLAWNQSSGMMPYRCYIYDRYSRRAQELSAVESRVKPLFSKDEKLLLGTHESSSHTTRIIIWRQSDSSFDFWAEKTVRGPLRGFCLDESHNLLYIVSPGRIWSRLDISTTGLIDLDSDSNETRKNRIEYGVSRDGTRMIVLRWQVEKLELQAVDLEDLSELYKTRLKLPGGIEDTDEDPLLIKFSSDLEVVFIGNILLGTKASDPEPIFLPLARVHKQSLGWSCSFSPCSTYIVLAYDPGFSSAHNHSPSPDHSAQLHIFHFDIRNKVYTRCSTQAVSLSQYDQQTFDFHPHLPELVLNTVASPIKYKDYVKDSLSGPNPGYTINDFKITTQLLDLEKGTAITLESPTIHGTLELGQSAHIGYAACGTYVRLYLNKYPYLSWRIPSRHPPPTPVLPKVLGYGLYGSYGSNHIPFSDLGLALRTYTIGTLPHILPRSETVPPLTIVPEHLKGAYITFLLGDKPGSTVRALFATIDGEFEMKYLGFTINQYLERFSAWYEESAQLRRDLLAAEAVEEDALTDYSDAGDAMSDYSDESEVSD